MMLNSIIKLFTHAALVFVALSACQKAPPTDKASTLMGGGLPAGPQADRQAEFQFRSLFTSLLAEAGVSREDQLQAIFYTPDELLKPPTRSGAGMAKNLAAIDAHYKNHLPEDLYRLGLCNPPDRRQIKSGKGPITLILFPGFTTEFIPFDAFEEVLSDQKSSFARKMVPILEGLSDTVYRVKDQSYQTVKMSEIVRVASYDRKGAPWVNLISLSAKLGSLESLGPLRPLTEIYARRLQKILHNTRGVSDLGEIYLLGFSRGAVAGLDFLSYMSEQPRQQYPWFERVRGLVSLGGSLYGSDGPDHAFSGDNSEDSATKKMIDRLIEGLLPEPPASLSGQAYAAEAARRVHHNMALWTQVMREMKGVGQQPPKPGSAGALLATEESLRQSGDYPEKPGILANFETFKAVLFDLLTMQCPFSCYFQNVRAFKEILSAFIAGGWELTTQKRLEWWANARLPVRYRILSLTATMPGPPVDQKLSPLLASPYTGYRSPDFVSRLRPGYYSQLEYGASYLNDSAMTVARARYWPQLDSVSGRRHDYLGILGAHHYGIAFPYAMADRNRTPNPFPRTTLLAAIGAYLREFP